MHMMTRIVFMGSPEFAVPVLRALARQYPVVGVVTRPDRPSGRGGRLTAPPVKFAASELGLPILQPEKLTSPDAIQSLSALSPELIVVAAFGQILKPGVLDMPLHGCLNVHASLLPRWRGAAPIQAAILAGDSETGITIMQMDAGLDTGAILSQRSVSIQPDDTGGSLSEKLAQLGAQLVLETLPKYLPPGGDLAAMPQDSSRATYAPMLKKEDGRLDFALPASELARRVRAMNPWPGAYFVWGGSPIKVHRAHVEPGTAPVGERLEVARLPAIGTSLDLLVLDEVQPAGKRAMPGRDFLLGARDWLGK
jgi:methionyl-tRNA formyltransferase